MVFVDVIETVVDFVSTKTGCYNFGVNENQELAEEFNSMKLLASVA